MKIESIIIDHETAASTFLRKCLLAKFPEINIAGEATNYPQACRLIKDVGPDLVFSDISVCQRIRSLECDKGFETVYISEKSEDAICALRQDACGFIIKPLNVNDIVSSVASVIRKIAEKTSRVTMQDGFDGGFLPHTRLVGVPTMEGIEFLSINEIVRCEGLQKCTRIVSTRRSNLVSSYNIGEFRKLLEPYGFFPCHKSHLINLMHVRKVTREGFVFLYDNLGVPLARRKRLEFLHLLKHL
jgi:two-component system LytT family response regulator